MLSRMGEGTVHAIKTLYLQTPAANTQSALGNFGSGFGCLALEAQKADSFTGGGFLSVQDWAIDGESFPVGDLGIVVDPQPGVESDPPPG